MQRGYVKLVRSTFEPELISHIAGLSHLSETGPSVEKLIQWGHESVLEFGDYIFKVKAPILVFRQLFRHRTGSFLEKSLRYCRAVPEFWIPEGINMEKFAIYHNAHQDAYSSYRELINLGTPPEEARSILGTGTYSEAYIKLDCRNLRHMLKLRLSKHTQDITRQYAMEIYNLIHPSLRGGINVATEDPSST